jgi:hypothetical protein
MNTNRILVGMLLLGLLLTLAIGPGLAQGPGPQNGASPQAALGTAFTYQGRLTDAGGPVNDDCDFEFSLWDEAGSGAPPTGGTQIGTTQAKTNVAVSAGLFTIPDLDFGGAPFTGDARWLQIAVRCPTGSGDSATLAPRQALTPAPYALALPGLWTQQDAMSPNLIGGDSANSVTSGVYGATIGGGGTSMGSYINRVTDHYGTVGGGKANRAGDSAGSVADSGYATVGGGDTNAAGASHATVGGGYVNTASGSYATIPGGRNAQASHYGEMAYASGPFSSSGIAQTSVYVLRNTTSGATPKELFLDGIGERLTIASAHTVTFDILLAARSSTGESIGCIFQGVIENTSGATSFIQTPGKLCHKGGLTWDANLVADDGNDALKSEVTGAGVASVRWVARVQTAEVSY